MDTAFVYITSNINKSVLTKFWLNMFMVTVFLGQFYSNYFSETAVLDYALRN